MTDFDPGNIIPAPKESTVNEMMVSRQAQEVQAAIIVAKKFPRNEATAYNNIMTACLRKGLAEDAEYTYPKGGQNVSGPSIRLAETAARHWGNLSYGIIELSNKNGVSEMMAYAWDMETNMRVDKIFNVKHWRDTKGGGYALKDSREIYELTANNGARRLRACILAVIPGDVIEDAVLKCRETVKGSYKIPLEDRFKKMVFAFESEFLVGQKQIEEYLGCNMASFDENQYLRMKGVYQSLRDGMSQPKDYFKVAEAQKPQVPNPFPTNALPQTPAATPAPDPDAQLKKELRELHPGINEWTLEEMIAKKKAENESNG